MHIMYRKSASGEYAVAANSARIDGKVVKTDSIYLGKVIDREKRIFENRERGIFTFDPETASFGKVDLAVVPKKNRGRKMGSVDFGDAYVLDRYMEGMGIYQCIEECLCPNTDTFKALLMFYILTDSPHSYAQSWYEGSYASILFPNADMDDRRITEFLKEMGNSDHHRFFFDSYIPRLLEDCDSKAFIIDSAGAPNSVHMAPTALNNHNGKISMEVRIILVCRIEDRMPLFFRYVPGNLVDSSTLIRTIDQLDCMNIEISRILIDAGYCTLKNMEDLLDSHINFITRLRPNYEMYKDMVKLHARELDGTEKILYKDRFVKVLSRQKVLTGTHHRVWLHLIRDENMKDAQDKTSYRNWQEGTISIEERNRQYQVNGLFILISSYQMFREDILPTYFERGGIEQLIDTGRNTSRFGDVGVHSESVFAGKLLVEFTALAVNQSMQNSFKARKEELSSKKRKNKQKISGINMCPTQALFTLRNQKCDVFDNTILPMEKTAAINDCYVLFNCSSPRRIDLAGNQDTM